jgi:tetratricopeptide (TPR) repeat protein
MNVGKFTLRFILISILSIIIFEIVLRSQRGLPPVESETPEFKYKYEEIYRRFFRKTRLSNGSVVYKTQRNQAKEQSFSVHKAKGTNRIFVLGGSVAYPFSSGYERYLKELLEKLVPGEKFEVIGCAMGAYDSYRVSLIHKEILNYDPDLFILLCGNNEYFIPVKLNLRAYRLNQLFRNLWIYRELQERFFSWAKDYKICKEASQVNRLANYENNLETMIRRSKKRKIPIILCTLPANFRDCPPNGSPIWQDKQFLVAWDVLNKNEFEEARNGFEQFLNAYPEDAFGYYFLAKCYDALGSYSQAQIYYLKALDLDVTPGDRCPPQRNKIIRRLCAQEDAILVDLEQVFIKVAPHGLVGKELFSDSCHWWYEVNSLVCKELAQSIIGYYKTHLKFSFVSLDESRYSSLSKIQDFSTNIPIELKGKGLEIVQSTLGKMALYITKVWRRLPNPEIGFIDERTISFLEIAYQLNPELFNNNSFLKRQLFEQFSSNWWMQEALPFFEVNWSFFSYHIGEALRRSGNYLKAIEYFSVAINLKPNLCFAYLGRALTYHEIGKIDKMRRDFEEITEKSCQHPLIEFYHESLEI